MKFDNDKVIFIHIPRTAGSYIEEKLCKKIYKHCFYILYNLSLRFNEDFFNDPNTHKNEIGINTDLVEEANIYDYHELY